MRTWGRSPQKDLVNALASVLWADPPATKTEVRVRGYTPTFILPDGAYTNVRRELPRVFGPRNAAGIKVQSCVHLKATGLERRVFNLVLQRCLRRLAGALNPVHGLATAPPRVEKGHARVQAATVQGSSEAGQSGADKLCPE